MEKDSRSRRQKLDDAYQKELHRKQQIREKYFYENQDLRDIHTDHDDGC